MLCLAFVLGIAAHSFFSPLNVIAEPWLFYIIFLTGASGAIFAAFLGVESKRWVAFALASMFTLGLFNYARAVPNFQDPNAIVNLVGQEQTLKGRISEFPRVREKTAAYIVEPEGRSGKIILTTFLFPEYKFGETLQFTCKLNELGEYEEYSRRFNVQASCAFPEYVASIAQASSGFRVQLFKIREAFHARLNTLFPAPYSGLLAGLLYGDTSGFSSEMKETFRITGISHITALSGYNVTIIARLLILALIFLWLTRRQALPLALLIIFGFVIVTGAEASVVRAAIMGFLVLGAKGIGRLSKMHVALTLAGAVMLIANPYLLRFDLGFQLSFLAAIALLWLADDFSKHTALRFLPKFLGIREAGAASAAAILLTAPLILQVTGMIGPFSLITNILIIPFIPFAMAFGFFAVAADFLFHPLGVLLSYGARMLLEYVISIADFFARFGALDIGVSVAGALFLFGLIVVCIILWRHRIYAAQPSGNN